MKPRHSDRKKYKSKTKKKLEKLLTWHIYCKRHQIQLELE